MQAVATGCKDRHSQKKNYVQLDMKEKVPPSSGRCALMVPSPTKEWEQALSSSFLRIRCISLLIDYNSIAQIM